jgi:multidrug resistance efflux pump
MHMQINAVKPMNRGGAPRRAIFRGVRLLLAAALLCGIGYLAWRALTVVVSDHAYINADIVSMRAPIGGDVEMGGLAPGAPVSAGAALFHIHNPRFANSEVASELNRMQELVERLSVELDEAEVRLAKGREIFKHAIALNREKLIPPVQFLEEESKLEVLEVTGQRKREQLELTKARRDAIEKQVALMKETTLNAAFDGAVWAAPMPDGSRVERNEAVLQLVDPKRVWVDAFVSERHAEKFRVGMPVQVRLLDGGRTLHGRVEAVRAGVGRIACGNAAAVAPGEFTRRRVAVRVALEAENPFPAAEFFGVGRSVTIEL